jgi:hypothetical protein
MRLCCDARITWDGTSHEINDRPPTDQLPKPANGREEVPVETVEQGIFE